MEQDIVDMVGKAMQLTAAAVVLAVEEYTLAEAAEAERREDHPDDCSTCYFESDVDDDDAWCDKQADKRSNAQKTAAALEKLRQIAGLPNPPPGTLEKLKQATQTQEPASGPSPIASWVETQKVLVQVRHCTTCSKERPLDDFRVPGKRMLKTCIACRVRLPIRSSIDDVNHSSTREQGY